MYFVIALSIMNMLVAVVCANAQAPLGNGGQYAENGSIKIEQLSFSGGQAVIKITNKQTCSADEKVDGLITRNITIAPLATDTIHITPAGNLKIRAKTETNCGFADYGNVELTINTALPVTITSIKVSLSHVKSNPKQ